MKEENLDAMKYRKSTHLAGVDVDLMENKVLTIKKCWYETGVDVSGNKTDGYFLSFVEPVRDMVVNSSNRTTIIKIIQQTTDLSLKECRNTANWENVKIELYFDESVKMMGKQTGGIRIKAEPVKLPELLPSTEKWTQAIASLENNQVTIEKIKQHYSLSSANEKLLKDAIK